MMKIQLHRQKHRLNTFSSHSATERLYIYIYNPNPESIPSIHMVSPPQMPVPLKHMYNANILRADFTTSAPSYTPM